MALCTIEPWAPWSKGNFCRVFCDFFFGECPRGSRSPKVGSYKGEELYFQVFASKGDFLPVPRQGLPDSKTLTFSTHFPPTFFCSILTCFSFPERPSHIFTWRDHRRFVWKYLLKDFLGPSIQTTTLSSIIAVRSCIKNVVGGDIVSIICICIAHMIGAFGECFRSQPGFRSASSQTSFCRMKQLKSGNTFLIREKNTTNAFFC